MRRYSLCQRRVFLVLVALTGLSILTACNSSSQDRAPDPMPPTRSAVSDEAETKVNVQPWKFPWQRKASGEEDSVVEAGAKSTVSAPVVFPAPAPKGAYRLKVGDLVVVTLEGPGGLNDETEEEVDESGAIRLHYIGDLSAAGKTTTLLEREIEKAYVDQEIYRQVMARVKVLNRFYFIGGEVKAGGRYPIVGEITLSQAIIAAGNFTEWANPKKNYFGPE